MIKVTPVSFRPSLVSWLSSIMLISDFVKPSLDVLALLCNNSTCLPVINSALPLPSSVCTSCLDDKIPFERWAGRPHSRALTVTVAVAAVAGLKGHAANSIQLSEVQRRDHWTWRYLFLSYRKARKTLLTKSTFFNQVTYHTQFWECHNHVMKVTHILWRQRNCSF